MSAPQPEDGARDALGAPVASQARTADPAAEEILRAHVRAALRNAGLSQAFAAEQLDVSQKHLSQMLTGRVALTLGWAEQLAALCGQRLVIDLDPMPNHPDGDTPMSDQPTTPAAALPAAEQLPAWRAWLVEGVIAPTTGPEQPPGTPSDAHTGAQGLAVIAKLRARLVAERDKTQRNAELARHEETRLANEGIAAGLETAIAYLDRAADGQLVEAVTPVAGPVECLTRVEIDPNVRVAGNCTRAGLEDADGPLTVGQAVEVYEPESGLHGPGRVLQVNEATGIVYLSVDWTQLHADQAPADPGLRDRYAEAISSAFSDGQFPVVDWGAGKLTAIVGWQPVSQVLDALMAVRDGEVQQLRNRLLRAHTEAARLSGIIGDLRRELAEADDEYHELAAHNDDTCEAVQRRDTAEATVKALRARVAGLEQQLADSVRDQEQYEETVVGDLNSKNIRLARQAARAEAAVARARALAVRWRDTPGRVRAAAELADVLDEQEAGRG